MAQPGYVYTCTGIDPATLECTTMAWMPPPSIFGPDLSPAQVGLLLSAAALYFATVWAWKHARRTIRD